MAVDKLVDSTQLNNDLTSVANAIRTKGGTSASLAFPAGFVSAVQNIPTGITPTGTKQISISQNGTTTEDVTNYASAEITVAVSGGGSSGTDVTVTSAKSGSKVSCAALLSAANATTGKTYVINAKTLAAPSTSQLFKGFYIAVSSLSASSCEGYGGIIRNNSSGTVQSIAWGTAQGTIAVGDVYTVFEINNYPTLS